MNSNQETLYGNRSQCYKAIGKLKLAKLDLNKALDINPKNTKNLKRLATVNTMTGNLGEAEQLYQKCVNLEPRDLSHSTDLNKVRSLINDWESLCENFEKENFVKCEEIGSRLLKSCSEYSELKKLYVQCLLNNVKLIDSINFLSTKLNNDEKQDDDFKYYTILAYYYNGQ